VTTLCGYGANTNPTGFSIGTCLGVCFSSGSDGYCDPVDNQGWVTLVYGCAGQTNGQSCDGDTNGGVLLDHVTDGRQVTISSYVNRSEFCTFQIDVGVEPWNGAHDFIVWQRDQCSSPPVNHPPVASCAAQDTCAPAGQCTADVSVDTGSFDPDGDSITVSQAPPGPYSLGTTDVTLTVSDGQLSATCNASVTINDCEPPTVSCQDTVAECTGNRSATVDPPPGTAADLCSSVSVTDPPPAIYPLGPPDTDVVYTATDAYGNSASTTCTVAVRDTLRPECTESEPITIEPPNHTYHRINLAQDCQVSCTDICEGPVSLDTGAIVYVTSDEPDNGLGDGDTESDIVIIDGQNVDVRAERSGNRNGRCYTIHFQIADGSGNVNRDAVCTVGVEHGNSSPVCDAVESCVCTTPGCSECPAAGL